MDGQFLVLAGKAAKEDTAVAPSTEGVGLFSFLALSRSGCPQRAPVRMGAGVIASIDR